MPTAFYAKAKLFGVAQALNALRLRLGAGQGREEHAGQDGNDGDDHQQLDQGESPASPFGSSRNWDQLLSLWSSHGSIWMLGFRAFARRADNAATFNEPARGRLACFSHSKHCHAGSQCPPPLRSHGQSGQDGRAPVRRHKGRRSSGIEAFRESSSPSDHHVA